MKILVLNCGSSSIKYALYNMDTKEVIASGGAERVGLDGAFVKVKLASGEKKQIMHDMPEHTEGPLLEQLRELTRGGARVAVSDPFYAPF